MRKYAKIWYGIMLGILGLVFVTAGDIGAVVEEEEQPGCKEEGIGEPAEVMLPGQELDKSQVKAAEYVAGELIVKLKEGRTLTDIEELNNKYAVSATEDVFPKITDPNQTLDELKNKLANFSTGHDTWYWQMDKNSQEYKDYQAKMDEEKAALENEIKVQEELIAHLEERQKRVPEGAESPKLENTYILKTDQNANIQDMAQEYSANPNVEYAEPDYIGCAQMTPPDDKYYSSQWGFRKIEADKVWDTGNGKTNVIVAIVDTGIKYNHPDLKGKIILGYDFVNHDGDPMDDHGHGTHCAGIVAALTNNKIGIAGISWNSKLMAVKVLDNNGKYKSSVLSKGIKYAADRSVDVINLSLGQDKPSFVVAEAVEYAFSKGCILVASAGNDNSSKPQTPAAFSNVIAVAATDENDKKADFSNYGDLVDISAPGVDIMSTVNAECPAAGTSTPYVDCYGCWSGTSMACPHVVGVIALVLPLAQRHGYDNQKIMSIFIEAVDNIDSLNPKYKKRLGKGRLNAYKAVQIMKNKPPVAVILTNIVGDNRDSPITVRFFGDSSFDSDGTIVSYLWDFGDGKFSNSMRPIHTFYRDGIIYHGAKKREYTVTLTVKDNLGVSSTAKTIITVYFNRGY